MFWWRCISNLLFYCRVKIIFLQKSYVQSYPEIKPAVQWHIHLFFSSMRWHRESIQSVLSAVSDVTNEGRHLWRVCTSSTVALTQKQQFVYNLDMAFDSAFIIREDFMHICSMHCYSSSNKEAFWTELKIRDIWHSFSHKSFWELGGRGLWPFQQAAPVLGFSVLSKHYHPNTSSSRRGQYSPLIKRAADWRESLCRAVGLSISSNAKRLPKLW